MVQDGDSKSGSTQEPMVGRGWAQRFGLPAIGALTLGAMAVCVVSGIVVTTGFEPADAVQSILRFETARPYGWFFRALHAWSAHLALVGLIGHTVEYVARRGDRQTTVGTWLLLVASLPVMAYLMLGGRALVGDAEAGGIAAVMHGLLSSIPLFGTAAAEIFVGPAGGDMHALLTHHVATATLALVVITVVHLRRVVPEAGALAVALGLSGGLALLIRPSLALAASPSALHGPWFMGGLRVMLERLPVWFAGLLVPLAFVGLLGSLPSLPLRRTRAVRITLLVVASAYAVLTAVAGWS